MWFERINAAIAEWFPGENMWVSFGYGAMRIIAILVIGRIIIWLINKTIDRVVRERQNRRPNTSHTRRVNTVGKLLENVISYVGYFIITLLVLSELGIDLAPLIAGAGVVGLAIGFGAQSLVKDIITGFFIVLEDQFAVGDVIQTGQYKGKVEVIGLRTTKILSWTGEVHIVPNGMITAVTNYSINNSMAVVDIQIAYEANIDKAIKILNDTIQNINIEEVVKTPEVLGVQTINSTTVTIRVTAECWPNKQSDVVNKLNQELKKALDDNGIEIPYRKMVPYHYREEEEA